MAKRIHEYNELGLKVKKWLLINNKTIVELSNITGIANTVICDVLVGRNNKQEHKDKLLKVIESKSIENIEEI